MCPDRLSCPEQALQSIEFFAGRDQLNIDGLGEKVARQLMDAGLVKTIADLLILEVEQVERLERFAKTSAKKLVAAIAKARDEATFSRLLTALGIPLFGGVAAKKIAAVYPNMEALLAAVDGAGDEATFIETFSQLDGIGATMAKTLYGFFADSHNREVLGQLKERGLDPTEPAPRVVLSGGGGGSALAGKVFVITGTLSAPRGEIGARIEAAGGEVGGSVTKKTDYLVAGEKTGKAKLAAAEKNGVEVIDEAGLNEMLGG
jgi:DNA ligase (NAD+)